MSARPTTLPRSSKAPGIDGVLAALADPSSTGVPKYLRLQNLMVEAIRAGYWKPGDRLPAEKDLAALSHLSLGTVQRALRNLVDDGIIVRQQGIASFVAEMPQRVEHPWHCRFLTEGGTEFLQVYSKVLKRSLIHGEGPWNRFIGEGRIFCIERQLNIADEFHVFGRFYADRATLGYFWDCSMKELNRASFRSLVTRACRLPITALAHNLRLMRFGADICRRLDIKSDSTGIFLYAVARAGRDLIYYQEFFIPPTAKFLHFSEKPEQNFFSV